jgi:putative transposase
VARAVARRALFNDDVDRIVLLRQLATMLARRGWSCLEYCLMTTHYHLVVRTYTTDLARGMHALQSAYAQHFNRRHGEEGHVFFRRYGSVPIEGDAQLAVVCRYVALNPVLAGLCRTPEEWPWSSFAATSGLASRPTFLNDGALLALFGDDRELSRGRFQAFVTSEAVGDLQQSRHGAWPQTSRSSPP